MVHNTGYLHPDYARSLSGFGKPQYLPASGGWLLVRTVPGSSGQDAMGCYPLFSCNDWTRIHEDMEEIKNDLVSMVIVSDPFAKVSVEYLTTHFDIVKPFKEHVVVDLEADWASLVKKNHRYYARRSLKKMDVEIVFQPERLLNEWVELYQNLIYRHNITGIRAFSRSCFENQLKLPGLFVVVGRSRDNNQVIGMHLVIVQGYNAYSHLAAYSKEGYGIRAAYGIYWETIRYLHSISCRLFDIGAMAGTSDSHENGLWAYKTGWSDYKIPVYLCGKILNIENYVSECRRSGLINNNFFPAYRNG